MSLSLLALALFVFLQSAVLLGWFAVSGQFLGVVGIITVIALLLEGVPVVYGRYWGRRP
jgi:hypothetical protein